MISETGIDRSAPQFQDLKLWRQIETALLVKMHWCGGLVYCSSEYNSMSVLHVCFATAVGGALLSPW